MKKLISLMMVLVILSGILPLNALADSDHFTLSEMEVNRIARKAGMNTSTYHAGMQFSSGMTGYQMYVWLDEFIRKDVAALINASNAFILELESHPEMQEYQERSDVLRDLTDYIEQQMNYYRFSIENEIQSISVAEVTAKDPDASDAERAAACRRLVQGNETLEKLMDQFTELQPALIRSTEEVYAELTKLHDTHNQKRTPKLAAGRPVTQNTTESEFEFVILEMDQIGIYLRDEATNKPISGAKVTLTGMEENKGISRTVTTSANGTAIFEAGTFKMDSENQMFAGISIQANGYRDIEGQGMTVTSGEAWNLAMKKDDGHSYLKSLTFRGLDILHMEETIEYTPYNDAKQELIAGVMTRPNSNGVVEVKYTDAVTGEEKILKKEFTSTGSKSVKIDLSAQWCKMLMPGQKVTITMTSQINGGMEEVNTYDTLIRVNKAVVDKPVRSMKPTSTIPGSTINFTVPLGLPVVGDLDITMRVPIEIFDKVPVNISFLPDGGFALGVSIAATKKLSEDPELGDTPTADGKSWKTVNSRERAKKINEYLKGVTNLKNEAAKGIAHRGQRANPMNALKRRLDASVSLLMTGTITENPNAASEDEKYNGKLNLFASGSLSATISLNEPFMAGPIPVFVGFDLTFGLSIGVDMNFTFTTRSSYAIDLIAWRNMQFDKESLDIIISPSVKFALYAGVGVKGIAALYLRGSISLVLEIHLRPMSKVNQFRAIFTLTASAEVCAEFLIFSYSVKIIEKKVTWDSDKTRNVMRLASGSLTAGQMNSYGESEPIHYTGIEVHDISGIVDGNKGVKTVKYDECIYAFDLEWINEILSRQISQKKDTVPITMNTFSLFANKTGSKKYPIYSMVTISTEGGFGHGAFPEGIPEDAYVAMFDVAAENVDEPDYEPGYYYEIGFLLLLARHSEDKPDGTPGRYYPEIIVLNDSDRRPYSGSFGPYEYDPYKHTHTYPLLTDVLLKSVGDMSITCQYDPSRFATQFTAVLTENSEDEERVLISTIESMGQNIFGTNNGIYLNQREYKRKGAYYYEPVYKKDYPILETKVVGLGFNNYLVINLYEGKRPEDDHILEVLEINSNSGGETSGAYIYVSYETELKVSNMLQNMMIIQPRTFCPEYCTLLWQQDPDEFGRSKIFTQVLSFQLENGSSSTIVSADLSPAVDTGIRVSPAQFQAIAKGSTANVYYLEQNMGDGNAQEPCYAIQGMYLTQDAKGMTFATHPFHMGEFKAADVNPENPVVSFEMYPDTNGFLDGVLTEIQNDGKAEMKYFRFAQTMQLDLRASAIEKAIVRPGDNVNLFFQVMNTGNVPLSKFTLSAYAKDRKGRTYNLSDIAVSLTNPQDSEVTQITDRGVRTVQGEAGVSQFDTALDEGLSTWVTTSGGTSHTYVATVLMPEENHNYRATFTIPKNFTPEQYTVYVKIKTLSTQALKLAAGNGSTYDSTAAWVRNLKDLDATVSPLRLTAANNTDLVTITANVQEPRLLMATRNANSQLRTVPVTLTVEGEKSRRLLSANASDAPLKAFSDETLPDQKDIDLTGSDLRLEAKYAFRNGEKFVHLVIHNDSATPEDHLVLTAELDGTETWRCIPAPDVSLDYTNTLSMDVPITTLTGNAKGENLSITVSGNGNDLTDYNNTANLFLDVAFKIVKQPTDQSALLGQDAKFSASAAGGIKPYTYQWQVSNSRKGPWSSIQGANGQNLELTDVRMDQNGLFYQVIITDAEGNQLTSDAAMLLIISMPRTGDSFHVWPWILLLSGSVLLGCSMFLWEKRRKAGNK